MSLSGFEREGLVSNLGKRAGIVLSALISSLFHLTGFLLQTNQNPITLVAGFIISFVPYFTISLILGKVFEWRDENLLSVIIIHGFYNSIIFIVLFFF
ncbi:MAG: type II CAAX prenyl endopeptidase Rce1 family protein [Promethearchaeia archaeon]